jgi:hypothetical protein
VRASTALAAFAAVAYGYDALVRPKMAIEKARKESRPDMPLLHVLSSSKQGTARAILLGPSQKGDINANVAGFAAGDGGISNADLTRLPFPDDTFGSIVVSHALESSPDPQAAMRELQRVSAGPIYVLASPWWAPHSWLNFSHRWLRTPDGTWVPLWRMREIPGPEPVHAGLENALTFAAAARWLVAL